MNAIARILIVDDEELIRMLIAGILEREGHRCTTAATALEGLTRLEEEDFDVVLLDLHMPGMSGIELLERLQRLNAPAVPIVLTGRADLSTAVEAMKLGSFDFLQKPDDIRLLARCVTRAIEFSRARRHGRDMARLASEWETTFDASPDPIFVLDQRGLMLRCNRRLAQRLGRTKADLVGRSFETIFRASEGWALLLARLLADPNADARTEEIHDPALNGWFLVSAAPLRDSVGRRYALVVLARDVTERRQAEATRRRLLDQVLRAQEEERKRIARELHDGIGQSLTTLFVGMHTVAQAATLEEAQQQAKRMATVAAATLDEVRRMSQNLRPAVLDDLGLHAALERFLANYTSLHGIEVDLLAPDLARSRLDSAIETSLYRVVQEALTNVARHAQARSVNIVLTRDARSIQAIIEDDGKGFDPAEVPGPEQGGSHMGLTGMGERVQLLGGTIKIESSAGNGTTIYIQIPLSEKAHATHSSAPGR